ncbi:hypothetical protein C8R47DRAFT_749950 [Mycena vitilis]|nr:hypothetical protein C8R47DRAFT_749950 [Mycena vitilis]
MQFSIAAILTVLATGALSAPAPLFLRQDTCDIANCVLDLAPSVVSCGSAAAQAGVDPVSDASCLIAAGKDVVDLPASCNGCAAKFGVNLPSTTGVVGSIESGLDNLGNDIKGIF